MRVCVRETLAFSALWKAEDTEAGAFQLDSVGPDSDSLLRPWRLL